MELVDFYGLIAALEWSSPLSSLLIRVALDTLYCLQLWARTDRSLSRILQRNKPDSKIQGGDCPEPTHYTNMS
jgi:hypothetical protein